MQKLINVLVIALVGFALYYGMIVDEQRVETMESLRLSDEELQGQKNVVDEDYRRLELQFLGRAGHIKELQDGLARVQEQLNSGTVDLGDRIDETNYFLQQVQEILREDILGLEGDFRALSENLDAYKRTANRQILNNQEALTKLQDDLNALNEKVSSSR